MNTVVTVLAIVAAVGGRRDHGPRGPPLPPPPFFLDYVGQEARREYYDIMHNVNITIAEQKREVLAWAAKNNITKIVEEFNANTTKMMDETKQNVTALITKLPTALNKILEILNNENQTVVQKNQALADMNAQEPEAYNVILNVFDMFMPCACDGGGAGGPGGPGGPRGPGGRGGPGGSRGPPGDGWNPRFQPSGYEGSQGMNGFGRSRGRGYYDSDEWYDKRGQGGYRGGPYPSSEEFFFSLN